MMAQKSLTWYVLLFATSGVILSGCWGSSSTSSTESGTSMPSAATPTAAAVEECAAFVAPVPALELDKTEVFGAQDDAFSLKFATTNKWEYQDSGDTVIFYNLDKTIDDKISLTLTKAPSVGVIDINMTADAQVSQNKMNPKAEILENCSTTINGMSARKIVWKGDQGQFPGVKATQYIIQKGEVLISTEFSATEKYYDKHVGTAQAIVESLEIK